MSKIRIKSNFDKNADLVLYEGNCIDLLHKYLMVFLSLW